MAFKSTALVVFLLANATHAIDRHSLVQRFNPTRVGFDPNANTPMQLGNGNFAFGADVTGLQTLLPFGILSSWGWKNDTLPTGETIQDVEDYRGVSWYNHGRLVEYDFGGGGVEQWLIANPNRVNLGRVGLVFWDADGEKVEVAGDDIADAHQELDLWTGKLRSQFSFQGKAVSVETAVADSTGTVGIVVESPLLKSGRLGVFLDFPWNDGSAKFSAPFVGNWNATANHTTVLTTSRDGSASILHTMVASTFKTSVEGVKFGVSRDTPNAHRYTVRPSKEASTFSLTVNYGLPGNTPKAVSAQNVFDSSARAWKGYWATGGFVDLLTGSTDSRAVELQRRIILSRYLMRVNEAGDTPPQEVRALSCRKTSRANRDSSRVWSTMVGCVYKSVPRRFIHLTDSVSSPCECDRLPVRVSVEDIMMGRWLIVRESRKFHMEMYFWHSAHWALWNNWDLLRRSSTIYSRFLSSSIARAQVQQGWPAGARWPKMTDPSGRSAPGQINNLLIWQQPHPIIFALYEYRAFPGRETLEKWRDVVVQTANWMSVFAWHNATTGVYDLGPPMYITSEDTSPNVTQNPAFELAYWRLGLSIASEWVTELGEDVPGNWTTVAGNLAKLPVENGTYAVYEGIKSDFWTNPAYTNDHPTLVGLHGWLPPTPGLDLAIAKATAEKVWVNWNVTNCWGWDFPMLAMSAARNGEQEKAIEWLLHPLFAFDDVGMPIGGVRVPTPYFPGSGALLLAVAMMAEGWDGSNGTAPGFPGSGWNVRVEGLSKAL
ncbi:hypothetical protein C0991_002670 [Blastosporella zonata]|nr:hypothetical protein C0991_002670 [Blastosporella zonata]